MNNNYGASPSEEVFEQSMESEQTPNKFLDSFKKLWRNIAHRKYSYLFFFDFFILHFLTLIMLLYSLFFPKTIIPNHYNFVNIF